MHIVCFTLEGDGNHYRLPCRVNDGQFYFQTKAAFPHVDKVLHESKQTVARDRFVAQKSLPCSPP